MTRTTASILGLLVAASLASCSSLGIGGAREVSLAEADSVLTSARQSLQDGDHQAALRDLKALLEVEGLSTAQRSTVLQLFGVASERHIEAVATNPDSAEELADLLEDELPREIAVAAGIASAQAFIRQDQATKAWQTLRRLDERYPLHHERATAGRLLVDIGLALSHDDRGWWFFWSARGEGRTCLEYVVLTHPSLPRCDEAYLRLGEIYGEDENRLLAIERYSDLVLYHPSSPLRALAQARIPMLRLELLDSPEYDRNGLLLALAELEDWLIRFPTNTLKESVLASRIDCLRRLSSSDLGIARFYERVENEEGMIYHAERALEEAQTAGDAALAAAAQALITSVGGEG